MKNFLSFHWIQYLVRLARGTLQGFVKDECQVKASALTYYSMLSIVPLLAVLFGIAKGFGFESALEQEITIRFAEQKELLAKFTEFAYSLLQNAQGGVIAGVGTALLLWSVIGLLNNIESALNAIWKTETARSYQRKIGDYLATLIIAPLFLVASSSITFYINSQVTQNNHLLIQAISPVLLGILKFFPFALSAAVFTLIYFYMPNIKVRLRSACIGGMTAGIAFQLWQWVYIKFQIGVSSYGAIYGSFAALPLFLIWLQSSWVILLAGAELAFQIESDFFIPEEESDFISHKAAAIFVTCRCIDAFLHGLPTPTSRTLAEELGISLNGLQQLLAPLCEKKILAMIILKNGEIGYQPARSIDAITSKKVVETLEQVLQLRASTLRLPIMQKIMADLKKIEKSTLHEAENQILSELLRSNEYSSAQRIPELNFSNG